MWWKHKSPSNPCLSSVQRVSWSDFTVHKDGEWRDKRGEGGGQEARGCVSGSAAEAPPGYRSRGLSATNTQASLRTTREGFCSVCTDSSPSNSGSRSDCRGQPSVESHGPSACRAPRGWHLQGGTVPAGLRNYGWQSNTFAGRVKSGEGV